MKWRYSGAALGAMMLGALAIPGADAALTLTVGDDIPITNGKNVLAAMAINDSSGSSDLTLIIQITVGNDIVLDEEHECRVIMAEENIPSDADPTGWTAPDFDDNDWEDGEYGIGYGDADDNTEIGDGQHASVYSRAIFDVGSTAGVTSLILGVDYDDGCVIWINGVEVARASGMDTGDFPTFDDWTDQGGGQSHEASKTDPPTYETVEAPVKIVGNILAVDARDRLVTTWGDIRNRH